MTSRESFLGAITYWNSAKGFGFAKRDDGGPDAFVPIAEVESDVTSIPLGARVRFYLRDNPRTGREQACSTIVLRTDQRLRGHLKCWGPANAFAIIRTDRGEELWAHGTAFTADRIDAGEAVEFEIAVHPKNAECIAIFVERPSAPKNGISNVRFMQNHRGNF